MTRRLKPQQILANYFRMVKTKVDFEGERKMIYDDCLKMKDVSNITRKWNKKIPTISLWYINCEYMGSRTS